MVSPGEENTINRSLIRTIEHLKGRREEKHSMDIGGNQRAVIHQGNNSNKNWRSCKKIAPLGNMRLSQTMSQNMAMLNRESAPRTEASQKNKQIRVKVVRKTKTTELDDDSDSSEYEDDATPGPGSYDLPT